MDSSRRRDDRCAVCGASFDDIAGDVHPVVAVQVGRVDTDDGPMTTVELGPDRRKLDAVAIVDRLPRDVIFTTCSQACQDRVEALIAAEEMRVQSESADADTPLPHVRAGRVAPLFYDGLPGSRRWFPRADATTNRRDDAKWPNELGDERQLEIGESCAWCLRTMSPDARLDLLRVDLKALTPRFFDHLVQFVMVGDRPVHGWVLRPGMPGADKGLHIAFASCSRACFRALSAAVQADPNRGRQVCGLGEIIFVPNDPDDRCAHCLEPIPSHVTLRGSTNVFWQLDRDAPDEDRRTSVRIGGRSVPGAVSMEPLPRQVTLYTCSDVCHDALVRTIARADAEAGHGPQVVRERLPDGATVHPFTKADRPDQDMARFGLEDDCVWCARALPFDIPLPVLLVELGEPEPQFWLEALQFLVLSRYPLYGWPIARGMAGDVEGFHVWLVCCSEACRDVLSAAIADDPHVKRVGSALVGVAERPVVPDRPRDAAWLAEQVRTHCAWCLVEPLREDQPFGVFYRFKNRRRILREARRQRQMLQQASGSGARPPRPRVLSLRLAGREVPGILTERGSLASLENYDIGFFVCSAACEAELIAAARESHQLSVVH